MDRVREEDLARVGLRQERVRAMVALRKPLMAVMVENETKIIES